MANENQVSVKNRINYYCIIFIVGEIGVEI